MLRTIPELDVSLAQTWPVFVPSLYQTFFAKYNLCIWGGFGTNLSLRCTKYVPSANNYCDVGIWPRCGTSLGQVCFYQFIKIGQGLDLCHLATLGQTGEQVWAELNLFWVCHRFVPYLSLFFAG